VKFYNKGIASHLETLLHLIDDDHLLFTNVQGVGPIDIVRVNIKTGKATFYDAKSDREDRHKKRQQSEVQKKLGVINIYVNLHKRQVRVEKRVDKLQARRVCVPTLSRTKS
jgi:hypothetical protein